VVDRNYYRFRSTWRLPASPADVYRALESVDHYPHWWPEIRTIRQIDDITGEVVCRAMLPYELRFVIRQVRRDPEGRVLEASMVGDLEGRSVWTITGSDRGSVAVFDEEVVANKSLLRRLALIGRPVFRLNHALMMRHGQRGLAAYLA
jgi:Polyketide cyclase / dehydrase and lipid transport